MAQIEVRFIIQGSSLEEANKVKEALDKIYRNSENKDLIVLADAIQKNPRLVKLALKYI